MILSYFDENKKPITKVNVIKFWLGFSGIKFQFENGQVIEVQGVEQCFLYDEKNPKNSITLSQD